jgi:hypothetical protein
MDALAMDRWRWRHIVARTTLTLALFALGAIMLLSAITIGAMYYYKDSTKPFAQQTEYAGLRLGISPDEVMYIKGYPRIVVDEAGIETETKNLKQGKRLQDYRVWWYESIVIDEAGIETETKNLKQGKRDWWYETITVIFDPEKAAVIAIQCYSNDDRFRWCPSIAGVSASDSEQEVIRKLGSPDESRIMGVTKFLTYRTLGLDLMLTNEQLYMLSINDPKYEYIVKSLPTSP